MPAVNPQILIWARRKAGLSLEDAAKGIQLKAAYGKTGAERLAELEAGDIEPTRSQLKRMANRYNRPLITFYLKEPPRISDRGEDFRTLSKPVDDLVDANLDTLIRRVKASQEIVRDLLEDEETEPLDFIGSMTMKQTPSEVANAIVQIIDFDIEQFRSHKVVSQAFTYLRDKVESAGIFVILAHNLGSHHTNIPVEIFRGFVISDEIAPFVVINDSDAVSARSFTLLHELAHLWLGTTGISGDVYQSDKAIEQFCNQVAAFILLTSNEIEQIQSIQYKAFDETVDIISDFAREKNISRSMVAYKLRLDGKISDAIWRRISNKFQKEWRESVKRRKEKQGQTTGGPSYYVVRRNKLGRQLTSLTDRAMGSGSLTPGKASVVLLGVKPGNVHQLVSNVQPKGNN